MRAIRHLLQNNSVWFAAFFALALAMKALVPNGYMISADNQMMTVKICSGVGGEERTIAIPMNAETNDHDNGANMTEEGCSSSSFSSATMTMTDPVQLALALAFVMLAGLVVAVAIPSARTVRLRPPLRGPPTFA